MFTSWLLTLFVSCLVLGRKGTFNLLQLLYENQHSRALIRGMQLKRKCAVKPHNEHEEAKNLWTFVSLTVNALILFVVSIILSKILVNTSSTKAMHALPFQVVFLIHSRCYSAQNHRLTQSLQKNNLFQNTRP